MNKVVASGNVYQNGIAQGENEIQTAGTSVHDQAARQDLYPEPVKNAYDYYPSVNPVQEERLQVELNPDHTEAEPLTTVESGRPYQPSYREGRYESPVPKETTSRTMGHPDKQQPGYQRSLLQYLPIPPLALLPPLAPKCLRRNRRAELPTALPAKAHPLATS